MKTITKLLLFVGGIILQMQSVFAQTAEWVVAPKYSKIEYMAPGMYRVLLGGRSGIVDNKGGMVLTPDYDEIKPFYEGLAVFGDYLNDGFAIKGVVKENGEVQYAKGTFYLHPDFYFYSEGYIPVIDEFGKYGYLDDKCNPAFKFTRDETRPFVEGVAAIGEGEDFYWLTFTGEKLYLTLRNGGIPYGGTNFYNGKAYLWDQDGKFYIIDEDGRISKTRQRELIVDYLYRVDTGKGYDVEYTPYKQIQDKITWVPKQKNGLWSYVDADGKPIAPFQYDSVGDFSDGAAIASADGKWGLLHIVADSSTFYTKVEKKRHIYSPGKNCNLEFQLSVPERWQEEELTIQVKDTESGEIYDINEIGDKTYRFSYKPSVNRVQEEKIFDVEVKNNDISIWRGEEGYSFTQRPKLISSIRLNNAEANENDICTVTATIKNPSSIPVTTTVTLSGGGSNAQFEGKTVTLEIPPHSSKSIMGSFYVKKVVLGGWCSVVTSDGSSAKKSNIELKPH